jgi:hypothetical protein
VSLFNHNVLFDKMMEHNVEFASKLPYYRNMTTILVALSPFVYLAVLWCAVVCFVEDWRTQHYAFRYYMQKMYNPSDSVGKRANESARRQRVSFEDGACWSNISV